LKEDANNLDMTTKSGCWNEIGHTYVFVNTTLASQALADSKLTNSLSTSANSDSTRYFECQDGTTFYEIVYKITYHLENIGDRSITTTIDSPEFFFRISMGTKKKVVRYYPLDNVVGASTWTFFYNHTVYDSNVNYYLADAF